MAELERIVGFGTALVDVKITHSGEQIPRGRDLVSFVDRQTPLAMVTGGIIPNILSTLTAFSTTPNTRLLASTGNDNLGSFYRSNTDRRLGPLQVNTDEPTGVIVLALDDNGDIADREWHYGAAETVKINQEEIDVPNKLFISDIHSLYFPSMLDEASKMLVSLKRKGGNFCLNLAGMHPRIDTRNNILSALRALPMEPDIIIGNEEEFSYLMDSPHRSTILAGAFPNARTAVMTLGEEGSLMRFEGQTSLIPAYTVSPEQVVDVTGAGDTYTGIMLGGLYTRPFHEWTAAHLFKACDTASYGASLVVQSIGSRLSIQDMKHVKGYYNQQGPYTVQR